MTYFDVLANAKRYSPEMSIQEIKQMTLADYEVIERAFTLQMIDNKYIASFTAFQNLNAQATNKRGEIINRKFNQLFDYQKEIWEAMELLEENKKEVDLYKKIADINAEGVNE